MRLRILRLASMGMRILRAAKYPHVPAVCGYMRIPAVDQLLCHAWHVRGTCDHRRTVCGRKQRRAGRLAPLCKQQVVCACVNHRRCCMPSHALQPAGAQRQPVPSTSLLCARKAANGSERILCGYCRHKYASAGTCERLVWVCGYLPRFKYALKYPWVLGTHAALWPSQIAVRLTLVGRATAASRPRGALRTWLRHLSHTVPVASMARCRRRGCSIRM